MSCTVRDLVTNKVSKLRGSRGNERLSEDETIGWESIDNNNYDNNNNSNYICIFNVKHNRVSIITINILTYVFQVPPTIYEVRYVLKNRDFYNYLLL